MSAKPSIVVVEDSEPIRRILGLLLEGQGYHVISRERGYKAEIVAGEQSAALVLLDLSLPDVDGRAVLRRCHARGFPVIVVSAYASTLSAEERALAADVISKPFDVERLLTAVAANIRCPQCFHWLEEHDRGCQAPDCTCPGAALPQPVES